MGTRGEAGCGLTDKNERKNGRKMIIKTLEDFREGVLWPKGISEEHSNNAFYVK